MARFKTPHFEIIAAIMRQQSEHLDQYQKKDMLPERTIQIMQVQLNSIVNAMCREFAKDNKLFNETLFRAKCGDTISKININRRSA